MRFYVEPRDRFVCPDFVVPVPVDSRGLDGPTKAQAAGPRWRRTSHRLYVPADADVTAPEQRAVEAVGHLSRVGALTGWAVMRLSDCRYFDGVGPDGRTRLPVRLQMGAHQGRRKRPGIHRLYDPVDERMTVRGVPCTPPSWAVFDEMRAGDVVHAVVTLDMALRSGFVSLEAMQSFVDERAGVTGVPLVREALPLADRHSGSPPETRVRLLWQRQLGLPRLLVNVAVFTRNGVLIGYPDLLDLEAGLAIEYDGADHRDAQRHSDDVDREALLREVGVEVTRVTGRDLRNPRTLGRRLLDARSRARFEPLERRRWTVEP